MEKDDAIDSQIKRLEDYLLGNKQIVNAHEITIEQALALAYIARELRDRKGLIVWGTLTRRITAVTAATTKDNSCFTCSGFRGLESILLPGNCLQSLIFGKFKAATVGHAIYPESPFQTFEQAPVISTVISQHETLLG
jgi:hypothetical protein